LEAYLNANVPAYLSLRKPFAWIKYIGNWMYYCKSQKKMFV
jgi:hypothetical protein